METFKFSAKTVDMATEKALGELKIPLEELEITVVSPGRPSVLGLGGEPATIEVKKVGISVGISEETYYKEEKSVFDKPKKSKENGTTTTANRGVEVQVEGRDEEAEKTGGEVLNYLLQNMGVESEVYVRDETENGYIVFDIEGEDSSLLIGLRGKTMQSIQHIVRAITSRILDRPAPILVDVGGYRVRREDKLREMASFAAEQVGKNGRPYTMMPMTPYDRRIVHMGLSERDDVSTKSEGQGRDRHVVVIPKV